MVRGMATTPLPVRVVLVVLVSLSGCKKESSPPTAEAAAPAPAAAEKVDLMGLLPALKPPVDFAAVAAGEPLTDAQRASLPCPFDAKATYRPVGRVDEGNPMAGSTAVAFLEEKDGVSRTRLMMLAAEDERCMLEVDVTRKGPGGPEVSGKFTAKGNVSRVIKSEEGELTQVNDWRASGAPLVDGVETFKEESFEQTDKEWMRDFLARVLGGDADGAIPLVVVSEEKGKWHRGGCGSPEATTLYLRAAKGNTLHQGFEPLFPAFERSYQDTYEFELASISVAQHGRELKLSYKPFPKVPAEPGTLVAKRDPKLQLWVLKVGDAQRMPKLTAALLPASEQACEDDGEEP